MDIEGAEYGAILNSDIDTLRKFQRIGLEYHRKGLDDLQKHLASANFIVTYQPKKVAYGVAEFERR